MMRLGMLLLFLVSVTLACSNRSFKKQSEEGYIGGTSEEIFESMWRPKREKFNIMIRDQREVFHLTNFQEVGSRAAYDNFEPVINCEDEVRIGSRHFNVGDGPKFACGLKVLKHEKDCIVYSIGSRYDFAFEEAVVRAAPHCKVHKFDGTLNLLHRPLPEISRGITFHNFNVVSDCEKEHEPKYPSRCIDSILEELGHKNGKITWFKIDCQGCEYGVIPKVLSATIVDQVMVEIHGVNATQIFNLFKHFSDAGLYVFHKERNQWGCDGYRCVEYSLISLEYSRSVLKSLVVSN